MTKTNTMIMRTFMTALVILLLTCSGYQSDNNNTLNHNGKDVPTVVRTFDVKPYSGLYVKNAFDVEMSSEVNKIEVTIDERYADMVEVSFDNDELTLQLNGKTRRIKRARVRLPYNEQLNRVSLSHASSFTSKRALKGEEVDVALSGASEFDCDVKCDTTMLILTGASSYEGRLHAQHAEIHAHGASEVELEGSLHTLEISLDGASGLHADDLSAAEVSGTVKGASNVEVRCSNLLDVDVSGASMLTYTGNPQNRCTQTGASTVSREN